MMFFQCLIELKNVEKDRMASLSWHLPEMLPEPNAVNTSAADRDKSLMTQRIMCTSSRSRSRAKILGYLSLSFCCIEILFVRSRRAFTILGARLIREEIGAGVVKRWSSGSEGEINILITMTILDAD